jgi:Na+-translocating ferredoxin:NAD+ oxidoreductase RNF subunit RnfB
MAIRSTAAPILSETSTISIPQRFLLLKTVVLALTGLGFLTAAIPSEAVMSLADRLRFQCIGCHTGNAKIFTDPITGKKKETLMNIERKLAGDHADLDCHKCHVEGFNTFPHLGKKILGCMECHPREGRGAKEDAPYHFRRIEKEFKSTVHLTEHHKKFGCSDCHHPHYFEVAAHLGPPRAILENHNQMCLNCHAADPPSPPDVLQRGLNDPAKPSLVAEHASIPHAALHLRKARCLDCHSGTQHVVSHTLPLGDKAPGCVSCHTLDSVQARLYRYVKKVQQTGFTHPAMLKDGYVMGATRYAPLDAITYVLIGGTLFAVVAHGLVRIVQRRRRHAGERGRKP